MFKQHVYDDDSVVEHLLNQFKLTNSFSKHY